MDSHGARAVIVTLLFAAAAATATASNPVVLQPLPDSAGANFGTTVTAFDGLVAVGAFLDRNETGTVSLFNSSSGERLATLSPRELHKGANFGCTLASTSSIFAVGAQYDGFNQSGAAYIFSRTGTQLVRLMPQAPILPHLFFGSCMSFSESGDTLVVGAPAGAARGRVYVYRGHDGSWSPTQLECPQRLADGDNYGISVAATGNTVVVGANHAGNTSGEVLLYSTDEKGTQLTGTLRDANGMSGDYFGSQVAAATTGDGDTVIAVGAAFSGSGRGKVLLFNRHSATGEWRQTVTVMAPNRSSFGNFGSSLTLHTSGDSLTLLVGAWQEDDTGAAYLYQIAKADGAFDATLQGRVGGHNAQLPEGAFFGSAVAVGPKGSLVIGADGFHHGDGAAFVFQNMCM